MFKTKKTNLFLGALTGIGLISITGCGQESNSETAQSVDPITVYSARAEHLIQPIFEQFTADTGIEVIFQTGKANAMVERLIAEGSQTPADMLITVDAGNLWYAAEQGLFQPHQSTIINDTIPANLRDPNDLWTGLSVRARTFIYNKTKVSPDELSSYDDLADPKWQGRLCMRSSSSVYNKSLIASLVEHHGEEKTQNIVNGWVKNLATKPQSGDTLMMEAIAAGQCDIGIGNTYYFGRIEAKNPETPIAVAWANQTTTGTHVNISGAGITKHAKNPEGARVLLEWLASDKAQEIFGALNYEYPAKPNIAIDQQVLAWGEFKQDTLNAVRLGQGQETATKIADRAGYE